MKNKLLLLVLLISLAGCSKKDSDEYLLALDKEKLTESLNYDRIFFYKFAKIALRSSAVRDTTLPEYQLFANRTKNVVNSFSEATTSGDKDISVTEAILMYKDYRAVSKLVKETDEDIFPTVVEAINANYADKVSPIVYLIGESKLYNENVEHAILSMIVLGTKDLGKDFALYECSKTQPEKLKDSEEKTLLEFIRGVLFFSHKLHYLSEDGISRNITWLDKHTDIPLPYTKAFFGWRNFNDEQTRMAFLSMNYLFRGFDRLMMERDIDQERALEDFESFLKKANELGVENETVWAIESFLYLKKGKPEKALPALRKLKASPLCSASEQKSIQESIDYIESRDGDATLSGAYDKFFIAKIVTKYTFSVLAKINWEQVMTEKKVPHTAELFTTIDRFKEMSEAVSGYMSPAIVETGKKSIIKQGTDVMDKAKGLFK